MRCFTRFGTVLPQPESPVAGTTVTSVVPSIRAAVQGEASSAVLHDTSTPSTPPKLTYRAKTFVQFITIVPCLPCNSVAYRHKHVRGGAIPVSVASPCSSAYPPFPHIRLFRNISTLVRDLQVLGRFVSRPWIKTLRPFARRFLSSFISSRRSLYARSCFSRTSQLTKLPRHTCRFVKKHKPAGNSRFKGNQ